MSIIGNHMWKSSGQKDSQQFLWKSFALNLSGLKISIATTTKNYETSVSLKCLCEYLIERRHNKNINILKISCHLIQSIRLHSKKTRKLLCSGGLCQAWLLFYYRYGDMRVTMGCEIFSMWQNLGK